MDYYCANHITGLSLGNNQKLTALDTSVISIDDFKLALTYIAKSVQEALDYFEGATSGGLKKYYEEEIKILQAQLKVLAKYDESNARRQAHAAALGQDLKHAQEQLEVVADEKVTLRRKRLVQMFKAFLNVLKYFEDNVVVATA